MFEGVNYTWPESAGRSMLSMPCPNNSTRRIRRLCSAGGEGWMNPDLLECQIALDIINRILDERVSH